MDTALPIEQLLEHHVRFSANITDLLPKLGQMSHARITKYCHDSMTRAKP